MVEKKETRKISAEDIHTILPRYSAETVLTLLKEVAQVPDEKFDWNAIVRKSSTGISNAREYQMLWQHLAYCKPLVKKLDDDAEPVDGDSDLDCEVEAMPNVAPEVSAEAVAGVKVMLASGLPSKSILPKGPMTKNISNGQSTRAPSESLKHSSFVHGTNLTVPVSVQKQTLPAVTSAEGLDTTRSNSSNLPPVKKRKRWSAAEDTVLIAAIRKYGEGNWAYISKGDFKSERSPSQLSKRWNIVKKRKDNSNLGTSSQLSEAQLATRHAVSLALDMPMSNKLKASSSPAGTISATMPKSTGLATTHSTYSQLNAWRSASSQQIPGHIVKRAREGDQRENNPKLNMASEVAKVIEGERKILADIVPNYVDDKANRIKNTDQNRTDFHGDSQHEHRQGVNGPEKQIKENLVSITGDTILDITKANDKPRVSNGNQSINECGFANDDCGEDVYVDICD